MKRFAELAVSMQSVRVYLHLQMEEGSSKSLESFLPTAAHCCELGMGYHSFHCWSSQFQHDGEYKQLVVSVSLSDSLRLLSSYVNCGRSWQLQLSVFFPQGDFPGTYDLPLPSLNTTLPLTHTHTYTMAVVCVAIKPEDCQVVLTRSGVNIIWCAKTLVYSVCVCVCVFYARRRNIMCCLKLLSRRKC